MEIDKLKLSARDLILWITVLGGGATHVITTYVQLADVRQKALQCEKHVADLEQRLAASQKETKTRGRK